MVHARVASLEAWSSRPVAVDSGVYVDAAAARPSAVVVPVYSVLYLNICILFQQQIHRFFYLLKNIYILSIKYDVYVYVYRGECVHVLSAYICIVFVKTINPHS